MTIFVYGIKVYDPPPRRWLRHEEFFLDPINAKNALRGEPHYVITMYEVDEPINTVALLNRVNCFRKFTILEDTRGPNS